MINNKQDRQGVRTPADLEQKYSWKKNFSELHKIAEGAQKSADGAQKAAEGANGNAVGAQKAADAAQKAADGAQQTANDAQKAADAAKEEVVALDNKLTQQEIFNRLTNSGQSQGVYMDEGGNIYINADYIKSGKFTATAEVFFEPGTEEVEHIMKYCVDEVDIPADKIPLYDFNNDGIITVYDAMLAMWAAQGIQSLAEWSGAQKTEVTLTIDPSNATKPISFTGSNMWGRTFERSFGWDDAFLKSTEGGNMYRLHGDEKEWLNPPMQAGTEYRTTERHNNLAVYKKLDSETGKILWRTSSEMEWKVLDENTNTTYSLSKSGNVITLTGSDGSSSSVSDTSATGGGGGTTYELVKNGSTISLAGSDGTYSEVEDANENTTYTIEKSDNSIVLFGSDGSVISVPILDSHAHDITDVNGLQDALDGKLSASNGMTSVDTVDNEPDTGHHRFVFGACDRDKVEIFEYGGEFNLYQSQNGTDTKIFGVSPSEMTYKGNTVITSANIGSQSVNYATSAGSASTATKATQDGNGNNIAATYATKGEAISGTVVDITSSVSVYGSGGDNPITKAVDTGSSVLILFDGEQEFLDINLTVPSYLQSKLAISASIDGENLPLFADGLLGAELGMFSSTYSGYGTSLEIKYV